MILHLSPVPGLWVAVEELRRPELRKQPLIIGGLPHQRGSVHEANALAQQAGVHPGMSLTQAYQHCPQGVFLLPNLPQYEAVWQTLCDILRQYTPLVEPLEMGQAVCDLSGCERRWGDIWRASRTIATHLRRITGIASRLGLGSNRLVAQLAAQTPGGSGIIVVARGQERTFLCDLPITALPEIEPRLALTFQVLGLRTIGQLAALPASAVEQRFGAIGKKLHQYAHGIDHRPIHPPSPKPAVTVRYACDDGSLDEAIDAIHHLAEMCSSILQERHCAGKVVEVALVWKVARSVSGLPPRAETDPGEEEVAVDAPPELSAGPDLSLPCEKEAFPIAYRIHSMLPQPPSDQRSRQGMVVRKDSVGPYGCDGRSRIETTLAGHAPLQRSRMAVRTPLDTAPRIAEWGQRLLLRSWSAGPGGDSSERFGLQEIELTVSDFEVPEQLSFASFNRLDQTGMLAGMSRERLHILAQQEQVLTSRYGGEPFLHITRLDPTQVLAERRFYWASGLPGPTSARSITRRKRRKS